MVYELIRTSTDAPLPSIPIWEREFSSQEELVTEFARECRILRKGLDGDLKKAMKDGKPVIIEGIHLDPSIYLLDEESSGATIHVDTSAVSEGGITAFACPVDEGQSEYAAENFSRNMLKDMNHLENDTSSEPHMTTGELGSDASSEKQAKKASAKAIIVPIVLKMDEFDHKTLLEEWIACRSIIGALRNEDEKEALISKLMTIQDYLCSFKSRGIIVKNISATTFPQTLDALHSYLLQRIEEGCQSTVRSRVEEDRE